MNDFFVCKRKSAYEMRIGDWSSDVCSSDLVGVHGRTHGRPAVAAPAPPPLRARQPQGQARRRPDARSVLSQGARAQGSRNPRCLDELCGGRSEEHTSELQSLMRISYAVFCLKKKKKT